MAQSCEVAGIKAWQAFTTTVWDKMDRCLILGRISQFYKLTKKFKC